MTIEPPPPVTLSRTRLDAIEEAIAGMPLHIRRLTTQLGAVSVSAAVVEDVAILAGEFGFPISSEGGIAEDHTVLALQLENGDGQWGGHDFDLDRAWIYRPGSEHSGVGRAGRLGRPPRFATISIPTGAEYSRTAGDLVVEHALVGTLRESIFEILRLTRTGEMTARRARWARREIIATTSSIDDGPEVPMLQRGAAVWLVEESLELAEILDPMPSPGELAAALGVSDRWVRAAFQKVFGVSATAYFRARAIDGAHRQLRAAVPGGVSVTDVAMRWGFWHLGRFSATYRSYFGELPSETLARTD